MSGLSVDGLCETLRFSETLSDLSLSPKNLFYLCAILSTPRLHSVNGLMLLDNIERSFDDLQLCLPFLNDAESKHQQPVHVSAAICG